MLSVKPHGGSHDERRCRGSEEMDREEGRSTKASNNTTAMVRPRPLRKGGMGEWKDFKYVKIMYLVIQFSLA